MEVDLRAFTVNGDNEMSKQRHNKMMGSFSLRTGIFRLQSRPDEDDGNVSVFHVNGWKALG